MKTSNAFRIAALALPLLTLAACTAPAEAPLSPTLGAAVRQNMAAHIINPDPPTALLGPTDLDGRRAALALGRYHSGTVIQPAQQSSSSITVR